MQAPAVVAEVGDLVAAAEAGGDDHLLGLRPTHHAEDHVLAADLQHIVVALLIALAPKHKVFQSACELLEVVVAPFNAV
jgi:hypothetical protein